MNQKGFAITSVIYGLAILGVMVVAILMGTLSSTRNNVSEEAKMVEDFLISFNQTQVTYRGSASGAKTYTYYVPNGESGWYRIEAFGPRNAAGGNARGAYVTGIVYLNEKDELTFNMGTFGGNTEVYVKEGATNILLVKAGGGKGSSPGGTTKCYSATPTGGNINMDTFELSTGSYIGNTGVSYTDYSASGCTNSSYMRGYPTAQGVGNGNYYLVDGLMLAGANGSNDGKVIVERLAERSDEIPNIPRKNKNFDKVSTIKVSTSATIYYSYHDSFAGSNFKGYVKSCTGTTCNVGGVDLDDVSIVINGAENTNVTNYTVTFTHTDGSTYDVYKSVSGNAATSLNYGVTSKATGLHFSAYQPDHMTSNISGCTNNFSAHGNYYIIPVVTENMVVSAVSNSTDDANQLKIEYMAGESRQKWAIDLLAMPSTGCGTVTSNDFPNIFNESGKKEYRIVELTRYKALNIYYDENYKLNFVSASETFNSLSRNNPQIWNIYPMNDGTYAIKTVVPSFSVFEKSGFLFAKPYGGTNNINDVMIGLTVNPTDTTTSDKDTVPTNVERFYLYALDFSK